jgi:hypothetical protein
MEETPPTPGSGSPRERRPKASRFIALGSLLVLVGFFILALAFIVYLGYFREPEPAATTALVTSHQLDAVGYGSIGVGFFLVLRGLLLRSPAPAPFAPVGAGVTLGGFALLALAATWDAMTIAEGLPLEDLERLMTFYAAGWLVAGIGLFVGFAGLVGPKAA